MSWSSPTKSSSFFGSFFADHQLVFLIFLLILLTLLIFLAIALIMRRTHSKPSNEIITALVHGTYFDRKEITQYYEGFLRQAPTGTITQAHFISLYSRFFPFGDPTPFAKLVFRCFDKNESGGIEFDEYLKVLSVNSRGKMDEKIAWTFGFYDMDSDGKISREELLVAVTAIYRMVHGTLSSTSKASTTNVIPSTLQSIVNYATLSTSTEDYMSMTPEERTDMIISTLDVIDRDGAVSMEEFKAGVESSEPVLQGLLLYDGLV